MESQLQDENAEVAALVSGFSLNIASQYPNDIVANAVFEQELAQRRQRPTKVRETRNWRQFYEGIGSEGTPAEAELIVECELLNKAWNDFVLDPQDKKTANISKLAPGGTVSMKDLIMAVTTARDQQKGPGRAHRYLSKFLDTLDSHSKMLGTLPDQSLYGSIFCGVLKTLISASANHRKIIEALSKDLVEVGEVIEPCVVQVQLFCTTEMQNLIKRLYAAVFSFLRQAMGWYEDKRRKRLLNSFNENFYGTFSDIMEEIRRIGMVIHKRGMIGNHAETRDVREMVEEVMNKQREASADDEYWKAQLHKIEEKCDMLLNLEYRRQIGSHMANLLVSEGRSMAPFISMLNTTRSGIPSTYMEWTSPRTAMGPSNTGMENIFTSGIAHVSHTESLSKRTYMKDNLEESSHGLEEFIYPRLDPLEIYPGNQIFAEHQAVHAIKEWSTSVTSQILWISGPLDRHYPSSLSQIAASLTTAADEAAIPSLHLFVDWPLNDKDSIFNVLYSLIRQLISLLPEQFVSGGDFSPEQFGQLNNQLKSWEAGLAVLRGLLELAPPLLLLIIDGIDHLDYINVGASYIDSLLRLLQQQVWADGEREPKKTLKILFTTAGNCAALNNLDERDLSVIRITETHAQQLGKSGRRAGPKHSEVLL